MRIAYLLSSDIARYQGSTLKVKNQVDVWRELGAEVEIFCQSPDDKPSILPAQRFVKRGNALLNKIFIDTGLVAAIEKFQPDLVYIRYSLPNATFFKIQSMYRSVIEINTDDKIEYYRFWKERRGVRNFIMWILNSILRGPFLKRSDALIAVTKELSENPAFSRYNKTRYYIPNSVQIPERPLKKTDSTKGPHKLFFIGAPGFHWHGIDLLEKLAEKLDGTIEIHIVGLDGEDTNNLFWYGYLEEAVYLDILKKCHICVGSLGLYRKEMYEACTLKVREYIKNGYPCIIGHKDTAFLEKTPPWILEIPNREDVFDSKEVLEAVKKFCLEFKDYIVTRQESAPFFDARVIEKKRLTYVESLL